jgi:AraC family transcriptional regulator
MSDAIIQSNNLKEGQFYGRVARTRAVSAFILSEVIHKQAVNLPTHSHDLAYFTLILKGRYSEKLANKIYRYSPQSILWHGAGISHTDEIGEDGGCFFTIEIKSEYLANLNQFGKQLEDFFERDSMLVWHAKRLYQEFKNWQVGSEQMVEGIALEMLGYSLRKQIEEKHPPSWLVRVVKRLNEEFTDNFSIEELSLEAGVHPVYLAAVFRQFYHESIGEYVQKLRINHASKLLLVKNASISEIANSTGFTDQSHFTRMFKRYVGITPGAFRNSHD